MSNISTSARPASPIYDKGESSSPNIKAGTRAIISQKTRTIFRLRLFLFCLIEAGFIILAAVCLAKPIPLNIPLRLNDSEVKGGFTVVFIVWHSLAVLAGGHILADAFSREWSVQLANIVPGTTDRVSTVTSGVLDRIFHIRTKHASGTFKLAFLASLAFMALTQLAPGTISAATTIISVPTTFPVARQVSQIDNSNFQQFLTTIERANLIVRLEKIELTPFGFKLPANTLISLLPPRDKFNETLEYNTDIVEFHHNCRWEAPSIVNASDLSISAAGQIWSTQLILGGQDQTRAGMPHNTQMMDVLMTLVFSGSSISPLSLTTVPIMMNTSTSAYLFIGGNSSFFNSTTPPRARFAINLDNLPTTFVEQGVGVTRASDINLVGPLASVLLCDARPTISGGRVRLEINGTVDVTPSGQPPDGSFPLTAANLIFSNAFQDALVELEFFEVANLVNNVAADMFMTNSSVDWNVAEDIAPLDVLLINENVDTFMSSAAKAFIDGYRKVGTNTNPTFDSTSVLGLGEEQRLALTTSKGLFIATIVVDVIAIILLYALCHYALTQRRYPFDLTSVFRILSEDPTRRTSPFNPTMTGRPA